MRFVQGPQIRSQFTEKDVRAPFRVLVVIEGDRVVPLEPGGALPVARSPAPARVGHPGRADSAGIVGRRSRTPGGGRTLDAEHGQPVDDLLDRRTLSRDDPAPEIGAERVAPGVEGVVMAPVRLGPRGLPRCLGGGGEAAEEDQRRLDGRVGRAERLLRQADNGQDARLALAPATQPQQ